MHTALLGVLQAYGHKDICEMFNWLQIHIQNALVLYLTDFPKLFLDTTVF
jgi:hypothetical protein